MQFDASLPPVSLAALVRGTNRLPWMDLFGLAYGRRLAR